MLRLKIGHLDPKVNWKLQNSNHQRRGVHFLNLVGKSNAVSIVSNPSHSDKLKPIRLHTFTIVLYFFLNLMQFV